MQLKDLAVDHPYYCHENNYHNNESQEDWDTMSAFLDEYEDQDLDMNLVFRWDVHRKDDGTYSALICIMQQRRGRYYPQRIRSVVEADVPRLVAYLQKHHAQLQQLWAPLSGVELEHEEE